MKLSIIVVSYNTGHTIQAAVDSLLKQQHDDYEIVIVDNASTDNSLELLQGEYGDKINLTVNKENKGYGNATNEAFKQSKGEYIWLLNPDAQLTDTSDIEEAIKFMQSHPDIAIATTRIVDMGGEKETYLPHKFYPGDKKFKAKLPKLPGELAWVFGVSMLVRRNVFEQLGGFDEDYFVNGEDADFCIRARKAGFIVGYCGDITIKHLGHGSDLNSHYYNACVRRERASHLFFDKHYEIADRKRIARANKWHALADIIIINLRKVFGLSENSKKRLLRYHAVYDSSREYLAKIRS